MKKHFGIRNAEANVTMYPCGVSFPKKLLLLDNK